MSCILGIKVGMSQVYTPGGECVAVTLVCTEGCVVVQSKTKEKDGYAAIQLGIGNKSLHRFGKAQKKHFDKAKIKPTRWLREMRVDDASKYEVGKAMGLDFLKPGDRVQVRGTTKGRGFSGVVKRHHFEGGPGAHGSRFHRTTGSIGNHTFPRKVFKKRPMPGHYGNSCRTIRNIELMDVLKEENLLVLKGAMPGHPQGLLEIRKA